MRKGSADLGIGVPEERAPAREANPVRTGQVARPSVAPAAPPVSLTPDAKPAIHLPGPGLLWVFCPPGISTILPNCPQPGALPR
jgi:hypothetical protein